MKVRINNLHNYELESRVGDVFEAKLEDGLYRVYVEEFPGKWRWLAFKNDWVEVIKEESCLDECIKEAQMKNFDASCSPNWRVSGEQEFAVPEIKELIKDGKAVPVNNKYNYDFVNPSHYKKFEKETYQMMIDIWGEEAYIKHCEMCAFKYKLRAGEKPDQPVDRDLEKANWYLEMANKLRNK